MNLRFEEEKKKERRIRLVKEGIRFLFAVILVIILAWAIMTFAMKRVGVIGSAMETTLYNGEDVLINKTSYLIFSPKRNDVIAFYPEQEEETVFERNDSDIMIRRIIGLPGETVHIEEGSIYIDGEKLQEDYPFDPITSAGRAGEEISLAEDEYFVLSDNRKNMDDSRNTAFTKVKRKNLIGKVILTLNPFSLIGGPTQTNDKETENEK